MLQNGVERKQSKKAEKRKKESPGVAFEGIKREPCPGLRLQEINKKKRLDGGKRAKGRYHA